MAARSKAVPLIGGLVVLGGGYYFYNAGGDPKVAKKQVERRHLLNIPQSTKLMLVCRGCTKGKGETEGQRLLR